MQTQSHKDVVKNIITASQLEGELQLSQAQHGVAVLDIYNAEWGHCKALSETFRRLSTDAGDMVHLRFFSVECNAVLESLRNPEDSKAPARQKGMEFSPETLVAFWSKILEQRQNHSKPYFVFYKEGKMRTQLEGIDTPKICRIVHDLCKQQNAAAEYITNQDALHFWESKFSPSESEVGANEFNRAVRALLGADGAELSSDDLAHITAAVHKNEGGSEATVSASDLQAFVGDSGTLRDALMAVVAQRRIAAGVPAPSTSTPAPATQLHQNKEKVAAQKLEAAPRAPSPKHDNEEQEEEGGKEREAEGGDYPQEEGAPTADAVDEEASTQGPVLAGHEEEAPEGTHEANGNNEEDAYGELEDEGTEVVAAVDDNEGLDHSAASHTEAAADMDEVGDGAHDFEEEQREGADAYEELEEGEDGVVASDVTESSVAVPSSSPNTSQEAELSPHNAPTTPSPPSVGAARSPDLTAKGATTEQDDSTINQIFTNRWVTVTEEEMHVWNTVAALPLHYPESITLMADLSNDETAAREALPASPEAIPTLAEHLAAQGVPFADVNMMCIAADQKVGSESLSYGKLSLILMSCDSEVGKGLVPECEQFLGELSAGTLLKLHQPLAFTALALSASEAYPDECFYYCLPEGTAAAFQALSENDTFILNALTPLNTAAPTDGICALRIIGLPKVIELATTDESDNTMVLSQWFAQLRVVEHGADAITVHFVNNVCDAEFQAFLNGYIARLIEDENRLDKKQGEVPQESAEELGDNENDAYEIGDEDGEADSATEL